MTHLSKMNISGRNISKKVTARLRAWSWKYTIVVQKIYLAFYRLIRPTTVVKGQGKSWRYYTPTTETFDRAKHMFTKEPDTIDWLNTLEDGQTFWDIGANIGTFSIYAASIRNIDVLSFEPIYDTYAVFVENILVNQLSNCISPYNLAFAERTTNGTWFVEHWEAGSGDHRVEAGEYNEPLPHQYQAKLNILCYSIDDFIERFSLDVPNYIKIDVDGGENKILRGAQQSLRSDTLRSVLVEIDERLATTKEEVTGLLSNTGFYLDGIYPLKGGPTNTMFNYVYWRT